MDTLSSIVEIFHSVIHGAINPVIARAGTMTPGNRDTLVVPVLHLSAHTHFTK